MDRLIRWVKPDEWPQCPDEFSGSYWSGLAYVAPNEHSIELTAHIDFVVYDAGVGIWRGTADPNGDNDIEPARILALYYVPDLPDELQEIGRQIADELGKKMPFQWYGHPPEFTYESAKAKREHNQ